MKALIFIIFSFLFVNCYSQKDPIKIINLEYYIIVDEMPSFPGGDEGLRDYINANLKYPKEAIKDSIAGKIYLSFIINEEGYPDYIEIIRGFDKSYDSRIKNILDDGEGIYSGRENLTKEYYSGLSIYTPFYNEAIRVIKSMPRWTPGKKDGKPVKVIYTVPINFTLDKNQ